MKKLFAVIGDPVEHSMSPLMHNDLFQYYGLDAYYHAFRVKRSDLEAAVNGFRAIGISGFNVTVPHKVAIIPFLDRIDPLAQSIGAVNTVKNEDGLLVGYNTDGSGYVKGLYTEIPSLLNKKVLIIGAGGAARAIYFTMAHGGVKYIDIANRTVANADELKKDCPYDVTTHTMNLQEAEAQIGQYECIIQTTMVGMAPNIEWEPISLHNLSESTFVGDIIYNPLETKFLQSAKLKGAKTQNGIKMFVYQGALAFEKWTGIFPDIARMKTKVESLLGGTKC